MCSRMICARPSKELVEGGEFGCFRRQGEDLLLRGYFWQSGGAPSWKYHKRGGSLVGNILSGDNYSKPMQNPSICKTTNFYCNNFWTHHSISKSIFEILGKSQSHGQNRVQRLRYIILWQIETHWCLKSVNSGFARAIAPHLKTLTFLHQGLTNKKEYMTLFRTLRGKYLVVVQIFTMLKQICLALIGIANLFFF